MDTGENPQESAKQTRARLRELSRNHQIEVLTVILLSLASLLATWSGFQGSRWNGEQTEFYSRASAARTESSRFGLLASQLELLDLGTFNVYSVAIANNDPRLADFHRNQFRPDFQPAFEAWLALDPLNNSNAPASPFLMSEYRLPEQIASEENAAEATHLFEQGAQAANRSDAYILTTVFLAIVLFFLGISARIDFIPAKLFLVGIGAILLIFSLGRVVLLPRV